MLNVGEDSYVELAYADYYIQSHYASSNAMRKKWDSLSSEDKEAFLRDSTTCIDQLPFKGQKLNPGQKLAFPRVAFNRMRVIPYAYGRINPNYDTGYIGSGLALERGFERAQLACIENALAHAYHDDTFTMSTVNGIIGLKSKSVGPISESYDNSNSSKQNVYASRGIYAHEKVYAMFKGWLPRNYTIS